MKNFTVVILTILMSVCTKTVAQKFLPSDSKATKQTISLYNQLKKLSANNKYLIGHQDDLAYGVNWKYEEGRSDIKDVTGDYPALFGWDLSGIESNHEREIDGVLFSSLKKYIEWDYEHGGVNTFSWHSPSPLGNGKSAWDTTHGTIDSILVGGNKHELFNTWLDRVAAFLSSLKGKNGEAIPILFRPFHELTGTWFWWCKNTCSDESFKKLWRYEIHYLRDVKKLHNLIVVYNTSNNFSSEEEFLQRYPGDDVVDVVSFDIYQYKKERDVSFEKNLNDCVAVIEKVAQQKNKIAAVAEAGFNQIPYADWFTESIASTLKNHQLAYILFWRNAGLKQGNETEFYVPYKGHSSEKNFVDFYKLPETIFLKDISKLKIYQ